MFCNNCGNPLPDDAKFCTKCGAELSEENEVQAPSTEYVVPRGFSSKRNIIIIVIAALMAIATITTIVAVNSTSAVSQDEQSSLQLARRYLSEQRYEQAIIEFERVISINPLNVEAYLGMAEAYIGLGDTEKALEILRKGLELTGDERIRAKIDELTNPEDPEVSSSISEIELEKYEYTEEQFKYTVSADGTYVTIDSFKPSSFMNDKTFTLPSKLGGLPVKVIGRGAFASGCSAQKLIIPKGIEIIDDMAFENCYAREVVISDGVRKIGKYAFCSMQVLTEVTIPGSIKCISERAFAGCENLVTVNMGEGITEIGNSAFLNCYALKDLVIPDSVEIIDDSAFYYARSLTIKKLSSNVKHIGDKAFYFTELERTPDKDGFVYADKWLIKYSGSSTSLTVKEGTVGVAPLAASGMNLTSLSLPSSLKYIERYAFSSNPFTSVSLPDSLISIGEKAFSQTKLSSVTLPSSLEILGDYSFSYCDSLSSVTIPKGFKNFGYRAFYNTPYLTKKMDNNKFVTINNVLIAYSGRSTNVTVPDGVTHIVGAFADSSVKAVNLPSSLVEIGDYAFSGCKELCDIKIPEGVRRIGKSAFQGITMGSMNLPESLVELDTGAFYNSKIISITIPSNVKKIGDLCFYTKYLESVKLSEPLEYIGDYAFSCCGFTSIEIPPSVKYIGTGAFSCSKLKAVKIQAELEELGDSVFLKCDQLESVYLATGNSIRTLPTWSFYECKALKSVRLPDTIQYINGEAFKDCSDVTIYGDVCNHVVQFAQNAGFSVQPDSSFVMPEISTETIDDELAKDYDVEVSEDGTYAILKMYHGKDYRVVVPATANGLPVRELRNTFPFNKKIESVVIPEGVQKIGYNTFSGCTALKSITFPSSCQDFDAIFGSTNNIPYQVELAKTNNYFVIINGSLINYFGNDFEVNVPEGVTKIAPYAFESNKKISTVYLPESLRTIKSNAFYACSKLRTVYAKHGLEAIEANAFSGQSTLAIHLPNTVNEISDNAFDKKARMYFYYEEEFWYPEKSDWLKQRLEELGYDSTRSNFYKDKGM